MKKHLLTLFILFFAFKAYPQKISLDQLLLLQNKEWSDVGEYLESKGWELQKAQVPTQGKYGYVTWIHSRTGAMGANYWYTFMYSDLGFSTRATFSTIDKRTADSIKSRIQQYNMKKVASGIIDNDEIYSDYTGSNYAIRFSTVNTSGHQSYEFRIWNKNDYLENFHKK